MWILALQLQALGYFCKALIKCQMYEAMWWVCYIESKSLMASLLISVCACEVGINREQSTDHTLLAVRVGWSYLAIIFLRHLSSPTMLALSWCQLPCPPPWTRIDVVSVILWNARIFSFTSSSNIPAVNSRFCNHNAPEASCIIVTVQFVKESNDVMRWLANLSATVCNVRRRRPHCCWELRSSPEPIQWFTNFSLVVLLNLRWLQTEPVPDLFDWFNSYMYVHFFKWNQPSQAVWPTHWNFLTSTDFHEFTEVGCHRKSTWLMGWWWPQCPPDMCQHVGLKRQLLTAKRVSGANSMT